MWADDRRNALGKSLCVSTRAFACRTGVQTLYLIHLGTHRRGIILLVVERDLEVIAYLGVGGVDGAGGDFDNAFCAAVKAAHAPGA